MFTWNTICGQKTKSTREKQRPNIKPSVIRSMRTPKMNKRKINCFFSYRRVVQRSQCTRCASAHRAIAEGNMRNMRLAMAHGYLSVNCALCATATVKWFVAFWLWTSIRCSPYVRRIHLLLANRISIVRWIVAIDGERRGHAPLQPNTRAFDTQMLLCELHLNSPPFRRHCTLSLQSHSIRTRVKIITNIFSTLAMCVETYV